ncbi:MAG: hypothetical protein JXR97_08250 [Planctomycetes bacterium]|nr:hypothetical protein [Planctomycetota bacterium]
MYRKMAMTCMLVILVSASWAGDQNPADQLLTNGNMEAGTESPQGWSLTGSTPKEVKLLRDEADKHGGKASLRIDIPKSVGGKGITLQQEVKGDIGKTLHLSGY